MTRIKSLTKQSDKYYKNNEGKPERNENMELSTYTPEYSQSSNHSSSESTPQGRFVTAKRLSQEAGVSLLNLGGFSNPGVQDVMGGSRGYNNSPQRMSQRQPLILNMYIAPGVPSQGLVPSIMIPYQGSLTYDGIGQGLRRDLKYISKRDMGCFLYENENELPFLATLGQTIMYACSKEHRNQQILVKVGLGVHLMDVESTTSSQSKNESEVQDPESSKRQRVSSDVLHSHVSNTSKKCDVGYTDDTEVEIVAIHKKKRNKSIQNEEEDEDEDEDEGEDENEDDDEEEEEEQEGKKNDNEIGKENEMEKEKEKVKEKGKEKREHNVQKRGDEWAMTTGSRRWYSRKLRGKNVALKKEPL